MSSLSAVAEVGSEARTLVCTFDITQHARLRWEQRKLTLVPITLEEALAQARPVSQTFKRYLSRKKLLVGHNIRPGEYYMAHEPSGALFVIFPLRTTLRVITVLPYYPAQARMHWNQAGNVKVRRMHERRFRNQGNLKQNAKKMVNSSLPDDDFDAADDAYAVSLKVRDR